jgi:hypothetical protein
MHAYWTQQFGDWQRFEVPSALVTLAKEAAETWTGLVTEWERLRPDVKTPMSEDEYDRSGRRSATSMAMGSRTMTSRMARS